MHNTVTPTGIPRTDAQRRYAWMGVAWLVLALVPTVWPELDLAAAAWFSQYPANLGPAAWWWVQAFNRYVPDAFRFMVLATLAVWLLANAMPDWKRWRLPLAFVVLSGALGPGLLVNTGIKDQWQRARPYQVEDFGGPQHFTRAGLMTDQCNNNCSFVSGHVACGFFFASLMLVHTRRRRAWALAGCAAGVLIGFARMAVMDHWLSDVLWAAPITWVCSWVVWRSLMWAYRPRGPSADASGT